MITKKYYTETISNIKYKNKFKNQRSKSKIKVQNLKTGILFLWKFKSVCRTVRLAIIFTHPGRRYAPPAPLQKGFYISSVANLACV